MRKQVAFKCVVALVSVLALSACTHKSKTAAGLDGAGGLNSGLNNGDQIASSAIPGSEADLKQNVGDRVFFANDETSLSAEASDILLKQASWLKKYDGVTIQIEGHADERGTREYNISLSARRATVVRAFLVEQGVEKSRISTIAYGKERPVKLCDAESCWSQNRRAVTVITGGANAS
jgi:peptidoglycan-associated lipoprotein